MIKPLSTAQRKALESLGKAPMKRPRHAYDWRADDGVRFPLGVVAALRKRGLAALVTTEEAMIVKITDKGSQELQP